MIKVGAALGAVLAAACAALPEARELVASSAPVLVAADRALLLKE